MSTLKTITDLSNAYAEANGLTKKDAKATFDAVVDAIVGAITEEGGVRVSGLGTFTVVDREARTGRNPQTGEALEIPASKAVKFKVTSTLKEAVNA